MYHQDMKEYENLDDWVAHTIGDDSWRTVAEKLHTTHSTIKRRLNNLEADAVIELASAYGMNPIAGLVAAGSITTQDVRTYARSYTVDDLSDIEVAQVIVERLERRQEEDHQDDSPIALHAVADGSPDEDEGDAGDYDA